MSEKKAVEKKAAENKIAENKIAENKTAARKVNRRAEAVTRFFVWLFTPSPEVYCGNHYGYRDTCIACI